ncbi:MAG: carboxymuconolactone decarboxylase family protein [Actinobacteria bacterium]|nr:carboxymuconolactone decarboxylase family protein [Actinomycetota bacterium]
MTRIATATALDETELAGLDAGDRLDRRLGGIWAHRPEAARAWRAFSRALAETGTLSPRLVELVRLRIAFHNQCRSCMAVRYEDGIAAGVTEDLVCSLEQPEEAPDLTAAEKAALRYADRFATDHLAIDEALIAELRRHFSDGEIHELGMQCARMVGFGRLAATYAAWEDLPDRFREEHDGPHTPWGGDVLVRPSLDRRS